MSSCKWNIGQLSGTATLLDFVIPAGSQVAIGLENHLKTRGLKTAEKCIVPISNAVELCPAKADMV